ncbi:hypothetical protein R80B4_02475 [Fibrobacteres bacterium R8-0-B4]
MLRVLVSGLSYSSMMTTAFSPTIWLALWMRYLNWLSGRSEVSIAIPYFSASIRISANKVDRSASAPCSAYAPAFRSILIIGCRFHSQSRLSKANAGRPAISPKSSRGPSSIGASVEQRSDFPKRRGRERKTAPGTPLIKR